MTPNPKTVRRIRERNLMRRTKSVSALLVLSTAGVVISTLLTGSGNANAATDRKGCVTFDVVDRTVEAWQPTNKPPASALSIGTYADVINNAADTTQIGTATGTATVLSVRPDGHQVEFLAQQWQLPDGVVAYQDTFDRTAMLAGQTVRGPAEGITGRYAGLTGTMEWKLIGYGLGSHKVPEHFTLCPGQ
jgi:hypothetical protein